MADITIAAATVGYASGSTISDFLLAGETILAGEAIYLKTSDDKYHLALNTDSEKATVAGIALTAATADSKFSALISGKLTDSSAPFTEGKLYELSSTAGRIATAGDAGSGDFGTGIGVATSASTLHVAISASGGQVA
tara:strand:- start:22 stop:435 length:414 start_codon:yes stop_codon:yes gene_type:complete